MQLGRTQETAGRDRDELFEALTDRRRRRTLGILRDADEPMSLEAVAEELARRTGGDSERRVEKLRIELYHRHLPKLAEPGLVEFDAERETVTLTGAVPETALVDTETTLEIE